MRMQEVIVEQKTHIITINQISKTTSAIPYPVNNTKYSFVHPPFGISKCIKGLAPHKRIRWTISHDSSAAIPY